MGDRISVGDLHEADQLRELLGLLPQLRRIPELEKQLRRLQSELEELKDQLARTTKLAKSARKSSDYGV
ncbi:MAG: hypothetical protein HY652_15670 [Acidobacteria bacterium]|nr:hypothetical protein [Acidobacteriota bacterium]